MGSARVLNTVVLMGSARDLVAPWGGDKRLCDRVTAYVTNTLRARSASYGDDTVTHDVSVVDPLEAFGASGPLSSSGAEMRTPHFYMPSPPPDMEALRQVMLRADCYVVVSPEYNHSVPPALSSLMGHFGASNYAYKPAATVTYSVGPWGGARGAMALRPFLAELGCLPVSKLTAIPFAPDFVTRDGTPTDATSRLLSQLPRMLDQLEWLTLATTHQRARAPPPK